MIESDFRKRPFSMPYGMPEVPEPVNTVGACYYDYEHPKKAPIYRPTKLVPNVPFLVPLWKVNHRSRRGPIDMKPRMTPEQRQARYERKKALARELSRLRRTKQ